jgi:hypothetical protein
MGGISVLKCISVFQVLAGATALFFFRGFESTFAMIGHAAVPYAEVLAAASIIAGITLWVKPAVGLPFSAAVQIPQAFSFAIASIAYTLSFGATYTLAISVPDPGLGLRSYRLETFSEFLWPTLIFRSDAHFVGFAIGVNLVAFALTVYLLWSLLRQRKKT